MQPTLNQLLHLQVQDQPEPYVLGSIMSCLLYADPD
jgi:hypothetical protein